MSEPYTHLLLTRFNVQVGFADASQRLEPDWLESRLRPFEEFCIPSVEAQLCEPFTWLVFCDADSPQWFRDRIERHRLVTPVYVEGVLTVTVMAREFERLGLVSTRTLITTRLDSDDAISRNHLRLVQQQHRGQRRQFISFPVGLQWYRGGLYWMWWRNSPFLSLIETVASAEEATTVYSVQHQLVGKTEDVRRLVRPPTWLQTIHESNNSSGLRGVPRLAPGRPNFASTAFERPGAPLRERARFAAVATLRRGRTLSRRLLRNAG